MRPPAVTPDDPRLRGTTPSRVSGRSWMVPLASSAHRASEAAQGVLREGHRCMFKWRAGVEVAVSAKLLRHLMKTWSRLKHGFK